MKMYSDRLKLSVLVTVIDTNDGFWLKPEKDTTSLIWKRSELVQKYENSVKHLLVSFHNEGYVEPIETSVRLLPPEQNLGCKAKEE